MRTSMARTQLETPRNSLSRDLSTVRAGESAARMTFPEVSTVDAPVESPDNSGVADDLRSVMGTRPDLTQKVVAIRFGCTEAQLSLGLSGARAIDANWLTRDQELYLLIREATERRLGLTPEACRAIESARIGELMGLLAKRLA